jgi:hypothetical protein
MTRRAFVSIAAAGAVALAACNPFSAHGTPFARSPVYQVRTQTAAAGARWAATLATPGAPGVANAGRGSAAMTGGFDDRNTYVSIDLLHATPAGVHPWALRRGRCGADEGAFGPADAYRTMTVDAAGRASSSATVPQATLVGGRYYVTVAASAGSPETSVACGDLAITQR